MPKKVIVSGLPTAVVPIVWMFIVNGIFGVKSCIDRKPISDERQVNECLKGSIVEPDIVTGS